MISILISLILQGGGILILMIKESGFVSAVVYVENQSDITSLMRIDQVLSEVFEHYELICCYDDISTEIPQDFLDKLGSLNCPAISLIYMGRSQGLEASMNAGVDAAVGDYIYEIDSSNSFDTSFILRAFECCKNGNDIVIGEAPSKSKRGKFFYPTFNKFSTASYNLTSSSCSLVSRRAVNRVRAMSDYSPYRKAAYAASGLSVVGIPVKDEKADLGSSDFGLAMDALALYTDAFYKISFGFSFTMVAVSMIELIYVIVIYLLGIPIGGWTTTMLAITFGFLGTFITLTFILKYVALQLRVQTGGHGYFIEGIEKLGK